MHGTRASAFGRGQGVRVRASQDRPGQARKRTEAARQRVRLRRPCNGSCQAKGVVTRERARSTDPRFHARTQQPAGAAIDPSGSISCASDAAAAALADRAESQSLPRAPRAPRRLAEMWGARAIPSACDNAATRQAQRDVPAAAAGGRLRFFALPRHTRQDGLAAWPLPGQPISPHTRRVPGPRSQN